MPATMMSLSLCFSTKSSSRRRDTSAEPEFEIFLEKNNTYCKRRWSRKRKAGTEVWCGQSASDIPAQEIGDLSPEVFTTYSGPDQGLAIVSNLQPVPKDSITVETLENGETNDANSNNHPDRPDDQSRSHPTSTSSHTDGQDSDIAGGRQWNVKSRKAYGICMSLYEQHPINGKISGEPIADSFGVCARKNNAVMIVADGVNWGEKSKLAARCAVYGSMRHINQQLCAGRPITNTNEAFLLLLTAVDKAHETIIQYGGGQTTLCIALVLPIKDSRQFAICIVNVGDSLAYVFSKYHGIREITTGSHDIQTERDIRDAGGAVGPVHGNDPELHNLTCSMTVADPGDIVYLTTDGISDNFDPVVTKIAVAKRRYSNPELQSLPEEGDIESPTNGNVVDSIHGRSSKCGTLDGKPEMEPHERHQYAVKEMERIIHEFELFTEQPCSAQELCGALLQHVLKLTDPKRKVLENPDLYGKKMKSKDRKRRDSEIIAKLSKSPGKLDHATIIGYEVGVYHGNDDEDYEVEEVSDEEMEDNLSPSQNPVSRFTFEDNHFADSDSIKVTASVARSNKHDSQGSACSPLSDTEPQHKHSLSPDGERSKKHAKALKNLKVKIRTRFKSPGRHKNRDRERSSNSSDHKSNSAERSPSKSPIKSPVRYSADVSAVQYSPELSAKSRERAPSRPKGSIIPERYMIKNQKTAPIASASESDLHSDQDSDAEKQNQTITYVLPEVIPYGIDLEDILFIDEA